MTLHKIFLLCVLCLAGMTAGCFGGASSETSPAAAKGDVAQCTDVFAYAPGAYVINIVSGDAVILDPLANDFPLFCDVESARKGLESAINAGKLPRGDWKIYRVYGPWAELATEAAPGVYLLNKPAPLVDWTD